MPDCVNRPRAPFVTEAERGVVALTRGDGADLDLDLATAALVGCGMTIGGGRAAGAAGAGTGTGLGGSISACFKAAFNLL